MKIVLTNDEWNRAAWYHRALAVMVGNAALLFGSRGSNTGRSFKLVYPYRDSSEDISRCVAHHPAAHSSSTWLQARQLTNV